MTFALDSTPFAFSPAQFHSRLETYLCYISRSPRDGATVILDRRLSVGLCVLLCDASMRLNKQTTGLPLQC